MADAGLYRLCVPASLGGAEAPPRELLAAVEELARADAAAGWCVAVCATAGHARRVPRRGAAREVFGDPAASPAASSPPRAARSPRRRADGQRTLALCQQRRELRLADGRLHRARRRAPRLLSGSPDIRLVLFPRADAEVIDTWSVSGLRGTGSHDMAVEALAVPVARSASLITDEPRRARPALRLPARSACWRRRSPR